MTAKTASLRIEEDKLERLDRMATLTGHSRNYHINEAVNRYLEYEEWFVSRVEAAQEDIQQGRTLAHRDVFANLQTRLKKAKRQ